MPNYQPRISIRTLPSNEIRFQYLVFPYANLCTGPLQNRQESFCIGPYLVWKDTSEHWQRFLNCNRPSAHLSMYVGREGTPLSNMWIATPIAAQKILNVVQWQLLTAALFYLSWCRFPG